MAQQRDWVRQFDTNRDGSLGDEEFIQALTTLDRERDTTRDRLKVKAAANDQSKDLWQQQDQLRRQDRDAQQVREPNHDRPMDRDRTGPSTQPRRGGGRGR